MIKYLILPVFLFVGCGDQSLSITNKGNNVYKVVGKISTDFKSIAKTLCNEKFSVADIGTSIGFSITKTVVIKCK